MSHFLYRRLINLNILHIPFLKSFSTTPSSPSFTVDYLINSCGLSLETALFASKTLNLKEENTQKPDYVLQFLNSSGFSKTQITNLITEVPCLLHSKVDTNLKPKFQFLLQMGFSNSDISELVISNPTILKRSLDNQVRPCFDYLKILVNSNENILRTLQRSPRMISFDVNRTIVPNVAHLTKQGMSSSNILKLILVYPNAIILGADRFVEVVEMVRKLGIKPESTMFVYGIGAVASMNKSIWEQKLEVFKSLGWSEEEIMMAFKREPTFMRISEEKLKRGMDFFLNTLKVERSVLILNPKLLMYGLDKRVIPRYAVLQVLKSKDLPTKYKKLIWAFYIPEKEFLETHVLKYLDKVPDLLDVYRNTTAVDGPILSVEKDKGASIVSVQLSLCK